MAFEGLRSRWYARQLGSDADRATFRTLHTASLASPALREGLTPTSVERSLTPPARPARHAGGRDRRHHRPAGVGRALGTHHADQAARLDRAGRRGRQHRGRRTGATCACDDRRLPGPARHRQPARGRGHASSAPSWSVAPHATGRPGPRGRRGGAAGSRGQLELAELDESRTALMGAEVRALRAQISPHFIYNSLGAIASLRAHRPRPGARAAARVRRLHPLLLPPATASSRRWPRSSARSSATCCSSRRGSATGSR